MSDGAPTLDQFIYDLAEVRRKVSELQQNFDALVRQHNEHDDQLDDHSLRIEALDGKIETIDARFRSIRDELKSLIQWRDRMEKAVESLVHEQRESTIAIGNLINAVTKDRLLSDKKDKKVNAVLMALITKWELPVDMTSFDEPGVANG